MDIFIDHIVFSLYLYLLSINNGIYTENTLIFNEICCMN